MAKNVELYRRYRPDNFEDVMGNETAIKSMMAELKNGSHVFLFTGPAGCGKTTMARILAKEVGTGDLSLYEINSANNRGVDTAREIEEKSRFNPSDGDSIFFILDEVHMMTNAAQNAFLKLLEDTPDHVYFALCTTDPQKLIAPLKSRCSIINVTPLKDDEMKYLLKRTSRSEGKKISPEVCDKIIELAQGGSRKALKLLAKVIYLDDEDERLAILEKENVSESQESIELCRALLKGSSLATLTSILKSMDTTEAEKIRQGVMGYMNAVILNGKPPVQAVAALQAFSNADTYRNGKFSLTVAILDFIDLLDE